MPDRCTYDYAIVRVVPRVERGEFVNVGAIVSSDAEGFLAARFALDEARLRALDPHVDLTRCARRSRRSPRSAPAAPPPARSARSSLRERFHWLVAPRSTIIQTSAVHTGRCDDLAERARASPRPHGAAAAPPDPP